MRTQAAGGPAGPDPALTDARGRRRGRQKNDFYEMRMVGGGGEEEMKESWYLEICARDRPRRLAESMKMARPKTRGHSRSSLQREIWRSDRRAGRPEQMKMGFWMLEGVDPAIRKSGQLFRNIYIKDGKRKFIFQESNRLNPV